MDKDHQSPFDKIPKLPVDFKITTGGTVVFNARVAKNLYPYIVKMRENIGYRSFSGLMNDFFLSLFNRELVFLDDPSANAHHLGKIQDLKDTNSNLRSENISLVENCNNLGIEVHRLHTDILSRNSILQFDEFGRNNTATPDTVYDTPPVALGDIASVAPSVAIIQESDTLGFVSETPFRISTEQPDLSNLEKLQNLNDEIVRLLEEKNTLQIAQGLEPDDEELSDELAQAIAKFEEYKSAVDLTFDWIVDGAKAYKVIFKKVDFYENISYELQQLQVQ